MRTIGLVAAGVALIGAAIVMAVDSVSSLVGVASGSGAALLGDGLTLIKDPACTARCPARYAFAPDHTFTVWISVRNDSAVPVTIDGPNDWLAQLPESALFRPVAVLGDDGHRIPPDPASTFAPIVLAPRAEWYIGIEFRTTSDVRSACRSNRPGTGVGFGEVPVTWHWLLARHRATIRMATDGFLVMAPTEADCARANQ